MQALQVIGIAMFVLGLVLVVYAMLLMVRQQLSGPPGEAPSRTHGLVLIGPIPIAFGLSRRVQVAVLVAGLAVLAFLLLAGH